MAAARTPTHYAAAGAYGVPNPKDLPYAMAEARGMAPAALIGIREACCPLCRMCVFAGLHAGTSPALMTCGGSALVGGALGQCLHLSTCSGGRPPLAVT